VKRREKTTVKETKATAQKTPSLPKTSNPAVTAKRRRTKQIPLARTALEKSPRRVEPKATDPRPSTPNPQSTATCPYCQATKLRCIARVDRSGKMTLFKRLPLLTRTTQRPAQTGAQSQSHPHGV